MTFDLPAGLALLGVLPVVGWLHRRRRAPRRQVVGALAPWLALRTPAPPRQRRIPPTVLLALHLAASLLVALAVAGPRLPASPEAGGDRVVLVDTTTSMGAVGRWPEAQARARALLLGTRGEATLVTVGPRPRVVAARAPGAQAAAALAALAPGGTGARLDEALTLARAVGGPVAEIVVVTDGGLPAPADGRPPARRERVGRPADNLAVLGAAARSVGGESRLFARLASFAARPLRVPVSLVVDGQPIDRREVELAPGATTETVWGLPAGASVAEVRLEGGDALPADDVATTPVGADVTALQMVGESVALARALTAVPGASLERAGLATFRADGSVDVSVFIGEVPPELPPGGVLVVSPPPGSPFGSTDAAAAEEVVVTSAGDHPLVRGLDLVGATLVGLGGATVADWAEPVLGVDGRPAVYVGRVEGARVAVIAFDPDRGQVAGRLAFPLLVARLVSWLAPERPPPTVRSGAAVPLPPGAFAVRLPAGGRTRARGAFDDTGAPGLYVAAAEGLPGSRALRFAVQAGDPLESDLRLSEAPLADVGAVPARVPAEPASAWPWLAALALGVMLLEGVWRATAGAPGAGAA